MKIKNTALVATSAATRLKLFFIPKVFQKLVLGCVKAPAVEFPQVGPYLEHRTHLRESQPRGFDAAQDQLLKHFGYTSEKAFLF